MAVELHYLRRVCVQTVILILPRNRLLCSLLAAAVAASFLITFLSNKVQVIKKEFIERIFCDQTSSMRPARKIQTNKPTAKPEPQATANRRPQWQTWTKCMDEDEEFKGGWKSSLEHGRYFLKRWVLSSDRKTANVDAVRGGRGGGSQTRGPEKERLPNFSRLKRGTDRISSRSTQLLWCQWLRQV